MLACSTRRADLVLLCLCPTRQSTGCTTRSASATSGAGRRSRWTSWTRTYTDHHRPRHGTGTFYHTAHGNRGIGVWTGVRVRDCGMWGCLFTCGVGWLWARGRRCGRSTGTKRCVYHYSQYITSHSHMRLGRAGPDEVASQDRRSHVSMCLCAYVGCSVVATAHVARYSQRLARALRVGAPLHAHLVLEGAPHITHS